MKVTGRSSQEKLQVSASGHRAELERHIRMINRGVTSRRAGPNPHRLVKQGCRTVQCHNLPLSHDHCGYVTEPSGRWMDCNTQRWANCQGNYQVDKGNQHSKGETCTQDNIWGNQKCNELRGRETYVFGYQSTKDIRRSSQRISKYSSFRFVKYIKHVYTLNIAVFIHFGTNSNTASIEKAYYT